MIGDVRLGEVAAVVLTVGVGVMVSGIVKSPIPAIAAAATAALLVCLYETALRSRGLGEPKPVRSHDA